MTQPFDKLSRLGHLWRYLLPYTFQPISVSRRKYVYLPLNREYKPVGLVGRNFHAAYESFSHLYIVFYRDPLTFSGVWMEQSLPSLFLYTDGEGREDYLVRLQIVAQRSKLLYEPDKTAPAKQLSEDIKRDLTVSEIETALDALLTSIEENEMRRREAAARSAEPVRLRCCSAADLFTTHNYVFRAESLARDPVGEACRQQIKLLGKMLFRISGSTDAMLESLERVSGMRWSGHRYNILDKWWSGIGGGDDWWFS